MKLQKKIQLLVLGLSLIPVVLVGALFLFATQLDRESGEIHNYFNFRHWLQHDIRGPLAEGRIPSLSSTPEAFVVIADQDGTIVASSHPELIETGIQPSRMQDMEPIMGALSESQVVLEVVTNPSGDEYRVMYAVPMGVQTLRSDDSRKPRGAIIIFAAMLLAGGAAGTAIVRDFQRRLNEVAAATHRIAAGDLSSPVVTDSVDEIRDLAEDLDSMRRAILESHQQRNRLLMGVSHDLGTPLTTILGYVEALEDDFFEGGEERRRALLSIRSKAELLQARVQELIEFVRFETGDLKMRIEWLNLAQYLEDSAIAAKGDVQVMKRRFVYEISIPKDLFVVADRSNFDRVMENLLQNAIRHTEEDDEIRVTAEQPEDGYVEIRIDDTGMGFQEMEPEESFELFRRGNKSRNQPGFGLGLPTVRSILESMGMSIRAERTPIGGAAFIIEITSRILDRGEPRLKDGRTR